jgi:hypothetical protein
MPTKTNKKTKKKTEKPFDCVRMKNEIQAQILAEYEARKGEFSSFVDFVNKTESPWERKIRERIQKAQAKR